MYHHNTDYVLPEGLHFYDLTYRKSMDSLIINTAYNANVGNHYNKTKNTVNQRQVMEGRLAGGHLSMLNPHKTSDLI